MMDSCVCLSVLNSEGVVKQEQTYSSYNIGTVWMLDDVCDVNTFGELVSRSARKRQNFLSMYRVSTSTCESRTCSTSGWTLIQDTTT